MRQLAKQNSRKCVSVNHWCENIVRSEPKNAFNLNVTVDTLCRVVELIVSVYSQHVYFSFTAICFAFEIQIF